jgi:hypothetical protein
MTKGNDDFKAFVQQRLNKLFDEVLYNVEMAVRSDYQYSILRKRILRSGNNALREIAEEVDFHVIEDNPAKAKKTETYQVD